MAHEDQSGPQADEPDADEQRQQMLAHWNRAAIGWGRRADRVRDMGLAVSAWMVERLALQPGERVLELAAGPGDTGFLAAELVKPGGLLISSDASEAMVELARGRAAQQGVDNAEFKLLELEWIDLPTASVDAIVCRWAIMLSRDPQAAARECRRVLRPGGRLAAAVWDGPERNPWATIPAGTLVALGHAPAPEPGAPGMFALAAPGAFVSLLADAGFVESTVAAVTLQRSYASVDAWLSETLDLSILFADTWGRLSEDQRSEVTERVTELAAPYASDGGAVTLPGSSLVGLAEA